MEKLSPKESVEVGNTALRGSVRAPKGFSKAKPKAAKPRWRSPQGFSDAVLLFGFDSTTSASTSGPVIIHEHTPLVR